jgi:peptide-methionine (R)-S-oxide reductase
VAGTFCFSWEPRGTALRMYLQTQQTMKAIMTAVLLAISIGSFAQVKNNPYYSHTDTKKLTVTNTEWKKLLPAGVYQIAREKATEHAYTGENWDNHKDGTYYCGICGNPLFASKTKFDSGTGWPSFYQPLKPNSVAYHKDKEYGMVRTEVVCARCDSHLGHVFDDGPNPTSKRFCMNGDVLDFEAGK